MDKINVSEFLGKRRPRDPSPASPDDIGRHMTYNAFLGFPVAGALAGVIRRLKKSLARWNREVGTLGRKSPGTVAPAEHDVAAFGELPPVLGSTKITFRN